MVKRSVIDLSGGTRAGPISSGGIQRGMSRDSQSIGPIGSSGEVTVAVAPDEANPCFVHFLSAGGCGSCVEGSCARQEWVLKSRTGAASDGPECTRFWYNASIDHALEP